MDQDQYVGPLVAESNSGRRDTESHHGQTRTTTATVAAAAAAAAEAADTAAPADVFLSSVEFRSVTLVQRVPVSKWGVRLTFSTRAGATLGLRPCEHVLVRAPGAGGVARPYTPVSPLDQVRDDVAATAWVWAMMPGCLSSLVSSDDTAFLISGGWLLLRMYGCAIVSSDGHV
mgnify:CR=1 FL=1